MPRKKSQILAIACVALPLLSALVVRSGCLGRRAGPAGPAPLTTLVGHRLPVQALAFGPDGITLTSVGFFQNAAETGVEVAVWDVATGAPTAQRKEDLSSIPFLTLALAPDGRRLAAMRDESVWVWDAATSDQKRRLCEHLAPVLALAFSADGRRLALADHTTNATLLDVSNGVPQVCCKGQAHSVSALAFAPDGATLAGGGQDRIIRLWDTATGQERGALRGHGGFILTLAFSPNGHTLASAAGDGSLKLWDVGPLTERATLATVGGEVASVAFSPDGRTLAAAVDHTVQLWDVATCALTAQLEGHRGRVDCLAFSPDGALLASGSHDCIIRLLDMRRDRMAVLKAPSEVAPRRSLWRVRTRGG
jgi:WD40 repeat protein